MLVPGRAPSGAGSGVVLDGGEAMGLTLPGEGHLPVTTQCCSGPGPGWVRGPAAGLVVRVGSHRAGVAARGTEGSASALLGLVTPWLGKVTQELPRACVHWAHPQRPAAGAVGAALLRTAEAGQEGRAAARVPVPACRTCLWRSSSTPGSRASQTGKSKDDHDYGKGGAPARGRPAERAALDAATHCGSYRTDH